jgi:hypothetical protein
MNEIETGGHAFPWCGDLNKAPTINLGMTLRDYFATSAITAVMTRYGRSYLPADIACDVYLIADAMLKARS